MLSALKSALDGSLEQLEYFRESFDEQLEEQWDSFSDEGQTLWRQTRVRLLLLESSMESTSGSSCQ